MSEQFPPKILDVQRALQAPKKVGTNAPRLLRKAPPPIRRNKERKKKVVKPDDIKFIESYRHFLGFLLLLI